MKERTMTRKTRQHGLAALALGAGLAGAAWAQGGGLSLTVNGAVASRDVRVIGGRPFVPLADVARAYNQTLAKRPGGFELIAAGGAGEVGDAHTAKIGEELFTGKWRFKVLSVGPADRYTLHNAPGTPLSPSGTGDMLMVVGCRVKNGMTQKHILGVGTGDYNGNTALTDDAEHAFLPIAYDLHRDKSYYDASGVTLLPGAAADVALVFSVPRGTNPKSLVFSLMTYDDIYMDTKHHTDVRVSLAP